MLWLSVACATFLGVLALARYGSFAIGWSRLLLSGRSYKLRLAAHEAGHAIVASLRQTTCSVDLVSIIPRLDGEGFTHYSNSRFNAWDELVISLAGIAGEFQACGSLKSGSESDFIGAKQLCKMNLEGAYGHPYKDLPGPIAERFAELRPGLQTVIANAWDEAASALKMKSTAFEVLTAELLRVKHITGDDLADILIQ